MPNLNPNEISNNEDEEEEEEEENNISTINSELEVNNYIDNELLINNNEDNEIIDNNNCYSIVNPAFIEDDYDNDELLFEDGARCNSRSTNNNENPFLDWSFVQDFFTSDVEDSRPPTPPPRTSSIESTKKEITIVVHLVSSPSKTPDISLRTEVINETTNENNNNTHDDELLFSPFEFNNTQNNYIEQPIYIPPTNPFYNDIDDNPIISQNTSQQQQQLLLSNFDLISTQQNNRIIDNSISDIPEIHPNNTVFPDLLCHAVSEVYNNQTSDNIRHNVVDGDDDCGALRHVQVEEDKNNITPVTPSVNVNGETSTATSVDNMTLQQNNTLSTTIQNSTEYQQLQQSNSDDEEIIDSGFIPRFVRASMRRVRRFRLSTRISNNSDNRNNSSNNNNNESNIDNEDVNNVTISTTVGDTTIDLNTTTIEDHEERLREIIDDNNGDISDVASTITDTNNDSVPDLPAPRQSSPRSRSDSPRPTPSPLGAWPHSACFTLAALGCTAGLFNLSRFAVICTQFGGPFLVQFLLLSFLFGIPLFLFHVALGHYLGSGVMDMWRISPVFQGVGIALLAGQALIGLYSIVGVSWLFIYFRDSFVTRSDSYKWGQPFPLYRGGDPLGISSPNTSRKLEETVPDYFSGVVLQRYNLSSPDRSFGHFKFQVAFNLAVVWMVVFVSLSKGLKSYGKVVFAFVALPVAGVIILCGQMFSLAAKSDQPVFSETAWSEFFTNNQCWIAAATETFMTWGMLGIATMQAASQVPQGSEAGKKILRDSLIVVIATITILIFIAFLADACTQILLDNEYSYVHVSSFEHMSTAQFLKTVTEENAAGALRPRFSTRQMPHSSLLAGNRIILPGSSTKGRKNLSGYQALRLATEILPATFASIGIRALSPFWSILAYFTLILFGIAQQLAVWHSVITGIIAINSRSLKSWETTITFFTCAFGYILGLPLTTELGIWVVYFLDTVVGSGWWLALLHCLLLVAVLVVRGRPYNGETIANTLFDADTTGRRCTLRSWLAPLLSFVWSVVLPIILLVLCVILFRTSESGELYDWAILNDKLYWPVWARELGAILQLLPVLVVPLVAMVQTCRYLSNGPPDLFDRIELLYRPQPWGRGRGSLSDNDLFETLARDTAANSGNISSGGENDPPPKYTPPPSYTTATGARIAKLLRESIRRSMRRLAVPSTSGSNPVQSSSTSSTSERLPPPPDYAAVLIEMRRTSLENRNLMSAQEVAQILRGSFRRPSSRSQQNNINQNNTTTERPLSTDNILLRTNNSDSEFNNTSQTLPARSKTLSAPQVAEILRSGSLRRSRRYTNRLQQQNQFINIPSSSSSQDHTTINLNQDSSSSNI